MDSYFKAAVCDLDKLLDEFEQNTDEYDCYRTPQNPYDSKHHSLSSVLDCLQPVYPTPKLQEDANNCTSSEEISLASHMGTSEVLLSYSPQNEKNVAGPDLLSTVDSGSLNEIQALNLRRCSVPLCDLVNDTGNLIHSVATHEDAQKLQLDDFQYSEGLIGFGISCIPVPACVSSAGCSGVSSTEQSDGISMLQYSGHLKPEEINHLTLKSDSYAAVKISDPCDYQHRTESVKCSEVFDQLEQTACLSTACVPVTSQNSNVCSPKDEKAYEKLPCEPQDESACSAVSEEMYGRNAIEKVDSQDDSNVESMPSDLPERPQLHKSHATLPGKCVLPGYWGQTGADVELEKKITEDNISSEELNGNEILDSVSTSGISVEDVQTSLSCLPLPVSICGSLVVTEEKVNPLLQNEMVEVISDTVTVHAGRSKTDLSGRESCENTNLHEQEGCTAKIDEGIVEKSTAGEKYDTENVIDDSDSQQIKVFASAFLEYEAEPYGVGIDSYYNESMSPVMADFTVEENVIKSDTLISDAELDDFLHEQRLQSNVLKSSDDSNLMEAGTDEGNLTNMDNLDFTEVTEEHMQAKLEEITSINSNLEVSLTASELVSATEENMSHIQDVTESSSEALVSDVCTEGARPKQLLGLSQGAIGHKQLNKTDVLERESQEASSVTPGAPLSGTSVNVGKNSDPAHSSSEAGGNQPSENVESLKIPATLSRKQPLWVPDSEAPNCMNCQVRFTFTKRRHHCRACGKVFCGGCCKRKCKLQYMEKEARVCTGCYDDINKAQAFERMMSPTGPAPNSSISSEYSSAVPPLEEAQMSGSASSPSPSALLPISVLKQPGMEGLCTKEQRRVWFADGILPNGEVADTTKLSSGAKRLSQDLSPVNPDLPEMRMAANPEEDGILTDVNPKPKEEIDTITRKEELCPPFSSDDAQQAVPGQSEVVHSCKSVTLEAKECPPTAEAEKTSSSSVDQTTSDMPVSPSSYRALCDVENCVRKEISLVPDGDKLPPLLLAVGEKGKDPLVEERPSHQQVTLLLVERSPNPLTFILNANLLVNVKLITSYPTPVMSFRHRKPLFGEIGHTIMNLLVDLRNYQYTLHTIDNLFVHVEMGRSCVKIPLRKYNEVMKVINSSNEHVISIGASFNTEADSHLVCVQNKHGLYHTQAVSATGHPRKVTGVSFVVFNGALKASSGFLAKSNIVEDGLMVQVTPETMESLRQALRDKKDFKITCGKTDTGDIKEYVDICWVENEEKTNKGILSPVDGKSMEGTQSEKVPQGRDFEREGKVMKCTEVYYFLKDRELSSPVPHQFAKEIAIACSTALCPHLKTLKNNGMNKIGLRVSVDSDMVEYVAGSGGHLLPQNYLNELDSALVPVIHGGMSDPTSLPLKMELLFFIIEHLF
ncbi:zinc finger FYVE domain-containing protein 16 isoform 2-T2 [Cariama cristata]